MEILFGLFFILFFATFFTILIRNVGEWFKNNASPRLTVPAKVVAKRSSHHHHHHADDVFVSWGKETPKAFTQEQIRRILEELDSGEYGKILRAKGIVEGTDGAWIHFDYIPGEGDVRTGSAGIIGRLCVIGSGLNIPALSELFGVELA